MKTPNIISDSFSMTPGGEMTSTGGMAARLLSSNFNPAQLRTSDVLRKDEWIQFDQKVIEVARQRLRGTQDLLSAGLRFDVPNALGTTRIEWETVSDMDPAEINMSGVTEGERDRVVFALKNIPLPIIHKNFSINIRALAASRNLGQSLDTTQTALATRLVSEKIEDILFNGATLTVSGTQIEGYTTATNRNTGSLTSDWAPGTTTGETIVGDVLSMIDTLAADNMFGPYALYVPLTYGNRLQDDFKAASDRTILERIKAIEGIDSVRVSSNLSDGAAGEVLLVQMSSDVVDMVVGQQPAPIQWEEKGGMVAMFKVMAIMVPRMKSDATTQSGIAHFSV